MSNNESITKVDFTHRPMRWLFIATMILLSTVYSLLILLRSGGENAASNQRRVTNLMAAKEALSALRLIADDSGDLPKTIREAAAMLGMDSEPKYLTVNGDCVPFEYFPGHSISDSPETLILEGPIKEPDGTVLFGRLDGLVDFHNSQSRDLKGAK